MDENKSFNPVDAQIILIIGQATGYSIATGQMPVKEYEIPEQVLQDPDFEFPVPATGAASMYRNYMGEFYPNWKLFANYVGLEDLFFAPGAGFLSQCPGVIDLLPEHKRAIDQAFVEIARKDSSHERSLCIIMLTWLQHWVDWALINCEKPAIGNV